MTVRDIWRNECQACGTNNHAIGSTPPSCAGCGQKLEPLRPIVDPGFWGRADGYSDERYRSNRGPRRKRA